jgi:hypothetical protein
MIKTKEITANANKFPVGLIIRYLTPNIGERNTNTGKYKIPSVICPVELKIASKVVKKVILQKIVV